MTHQDIGLSDADAEEQLDALKRVHEDDSAGQQNALDSGIVTVGGVFSFLFAIATVVSIYEIIVRNFFNSPTIWAHETVIALIAACYLYGGIQCLAADKHIRIGLNYFGTSGGTRRLLDIVNGLLAVFFAVAISYAAFTMVEKAWWTPQGDIRLARSGSAWSPITPALIKMALLVTAIVLAVQSVGHILTAWKGIGYRQSSGVPPSKWAIIGISVVFGLLQIGGYLLFSQGRGLGIQTGSILLGGSILILILTGIPLAFVTGLIAILFTIAWFGPSGVPLVSSRIYSFVNEYVLVAIPMFVLMASLLDRSGMARDLYDAMRLAAGRLKGGVAVQTLVAMIPPSIVLIVYGLTASVSIGDLFLATVTPGLMLASFYIIYILTRCYPASWCGRYRSWVDLWWCCVSNRSGGYGREPFH